MPLAKDPPFRAENVGSFLRPPELKQANRERHEGRLDDAGYGRHLSEAIRHVVRLQEDAGLHSITDGEFGRSSWFGFFFERLEGFRLEPSAFRFRDEHGASYEWPTCVACQRIVRRHPITVDEWQRLAALTTRTAKSTMPAPSAFHFFRFHEPADRNVYPDIDAYWDDLVAVYRAEIADLAAAGCRYVQLDEVPLAMLCDPSIREQVAARGGDPQALQDRYVEVLGRLLADRPPGMRFALHLCRGNFRNRWMASGGYEPIAEQLFNEVPVDAFLLEYDSPRAGDFSPLRHLPPDKTAVLGLVSSKKAELEPADDLKRRIDEASRYADLDRLALSAQCGFASVAGGNLLSEAQEIAKLELITSTARAVWG